MFQRNVKFNNKYYKEVNIFLKSKIVNKRDYKNKHINHPSSKIIVSIE